METYWHDGEEAERHYPYVAPMTIFTGEDIRVGRKPDNFEDLFAGGWLDDKIEGAAFRLLQELCYDTILYRSCNGITNNMMDIAEKYILFGDGVDGVVKMFRNAKWNDSKGQVLRNLIIDFCERLRDCLGCAPEVTEKQERYIVGRVLGERPSWWFQQLGIAIWGEKYFERMCERTRTRF